VDVAVRSATPFAVYVSDASTGMVQRFDEVTNPQVHTYQSQWGSAGSANSQFAGVQGAVVDLSGNIYVTDTGNNRVQKFDQFNNRIEEFDTNGNYLGQFGSGGSGNGQVSGPHGIATLGDLIYVADSGNNRIQLFTTGGTYETQFGSAGTGTNQFELPVGISADANRGELFISDHLNNRVQVYSIVHAQYVASLTSAAGFNFNGPYFVSTDQRGDVYVADENNERIAEFDVNLTRSTAFGSAGSGNGQFTEPTDAVVSPTSRQIDVVDAGNFRIQRFGSPWPKNDTVGIYRSSTKTFYLRNENSTGPANIAVYMPYALAADLPIVGVWEGNGVDTVGLYRPSKARYLLQDANVPESAPDIVFTLGLAGDTPIAGDWNGQGSDGAGIFRPSNGILYLKNSLSTGVADDNLVLGIPGDIGIAGDWNGDGQDSPGVYRPSQQRFYVTNKVTNGVVYSDASAVLGISGDVPFTGDWVAQGYSGIGVFRPSNGKTYEKNAISPGPADNNFIYGIAGDVPVAGRWVASSALFSAPAPHVSLGIRGPAPHPATGHGGAPIALAGGHPARKPTPPPAATPARRSGRQ
jgi:hypothetical protein